MAHTLTHTHTHAHTHHVHNMKHSRNPLSGCVISHTPNPSKDQRSPVLRKKGRWTLTCFWTIHFSIAYQRCQSEMSDWRMSLCTPSPGTTPNIETIMEGPCAGKTSFPERRGALFCLRRICPSLVPSAVAGAISITGLTLALLSNPDSCFCPGETKDIIFLPDGSVGACPCGQSLLPFKRCESGFAVFWSCLEQHNTDAFKPAYMDL